MLIYAFHRHCLLCKEETDGRTCLEIDRLNFFLFSFEFYVGPYQYPLGLMIVLCNLGSELQAIIKMFNLSFCYHEIFHFKIGTFFGFNTSKSLSPRLLEISRNFEISFLDRSFSTYDVNNK